jgi:hypothetical protein
MAGNRTRVLADWALNVIEVFSATVTPAFAA